MEQHLLEALKIHASLASSHPFLTAQNTLFPSAYTKMTQEELSEKADLHPTYVGSVERGERNIALENIIAIAKALRCSPKDLMPE